jgi:hypothetical protein
MPTEEVPRKMMDEKEHRLRLAVVTGQLLHGAHNEVHDLTLCAGALFSRFPQTGGAAAGAILSFADLGGSPAKVRATTLAAHGLAVGDVVIINQTGGTNYDTTNAIVTAVGAGGGFDFDYEWTNGLGGGTGGFWQGFTNARITPSTLALLIGASLNGLVAEHTSPYILQTANVGYIHLDHASAAATDQDFKVILFGD